MAHGRYSVNKALRLYEAEGEHFLLDTREGRVIYLNSTAVRIWEWLGQGLDLDEIVARMVQQYEVDEDTARRDLLATIARLREAGAVDDDSTP